MRTPDNSAYSSWTQVKQGHCVRQCYCIIQGWLCNKWQLTTTLHVGSIAGTIFYKSDFHVCVCVCASICEWQKWDRCILTSCTSAPLSHCVLYTQEKWEDPFIRQLSKGKLMKRGGRWPEWLIARQRQWSASKKYKSHTFEIPCMWTGGGLAPGIGECQKGLRLLCMVNHVYKYAPVLV